MEAVKKCEQAVKNTDYYRGEADNLRTRYNDILVEKQRLEQEVNSLRLFMEDERKELEELRHRQQELLNSDRMDPGDNSSLSIMYESLLRSYEAIKDDCSLIRKRYDDLVSSHSAAVEKLECAQVGTRQRAIHFP